MTGHSPPKPTTPADSIRPPDRLGILACLFAGALVLMLGWFRLSSLDIGYHLGYGRHFLQTGEIVGAVPDPFLLPETARPFVNANWGSQVIMALIEGACGAAGLVALRLGLIVVTFGFIGAVVLGQTQSRLAVAGAWLLAAVAGYERFSMRPELFSYAIMSAQLFLLVRGINSRQAALLLVMLQALWVNLHGYFLVGLMMTGAFCAEALVRVVRPTGNGLSERLRAAGRPKLLAAALALQCAACLVNPRHVQGALFPLRTLEFLRAGAVMGGTMGDTSASAWSEITEFQSPFGFEGQIGSSRTIFAYKALLGVALVGGAAMLLRGRIAMALILALFFAMSLQMRRNIAQFAFVGAPLCALALTSVIPRDRIRAGVVRTAKFLGTLAIAAAASLWMIQLADGRFYFAERRMNREFGFGYGDHSFPIAAMGWLAGQEDLRPNLFVDYFSSSNTIPRLPERFKLFVDTNTFACDEAGLRSAFDVVQGKIDHNAFFDQHEVNVVMLHCGANTQALIQKLVKDDGAWALVYADPQMVIFVRRIMPHVKVIIEHQPSESGLPVQAWIESQSGPAATRALNLYGMANTPLFLGWNRAAAALLEEAVKLAPDLHDAWINLGMCHAHAGNALMRRGGGATSMAERDRLLESAVGEFETAADCFERALTLDPGNEIATANLHRVRNTFGAGG